MSLQQIDLPVNYIVLETGYTVRILGRLVKLSELLQEHGINADPLFIHDTVWGSGTENIGATEEELRELPSLFDDIDGYIVFRDNKYSDAFKLKEVLQELDYCAMFGIQSVKYAVGKLGRRSVHFAIVEVDSESG